MNHFRISSWAWRGFVTLVWICAVFGFSPTMNWMISAEVWLTNRVEDPIWFALVTGLLISSWLAPSVWSRVKKHPGDNFERPATDTLDQMSVTHVAEHLLFDSAWGWRKRLEFIKMSLVRDEVAYEMTRAGQTGSVRYVGIDPAKSNPHSQDIDRAYWHSATIDDKIFDPKNRIFTGPNGTGLPPAQIYERGTVPMRDVHQTWPPANAFLKAWVRLCVFCVRLRYGFPEILRDKRKFERCKART
jgi:hypothetical protein